jgi:MFS family permease
MLFILSIVVYLDRVCIGLAAPMIRRDLGLTALQMGAVFSAFALAYGLFEIPCGWLGDRFGPRKMLTRVAVWWSAFTALTGRAAGFYSLWTYRFLFGAGEAGAYPNAASVVARWFPFVERARAQGAVWMASRLGGAIAPLFLVPLQERLGWRTVFYLLGCVGFAWAVIWYGWFRDYPEQKKSVSQAELGVIRDGRVTPSGHAGTPWRILFTSVNMWAVVLMYFTYGYGVNFFFFWMPTYIVEVRGIANFAPFASLPFILGALANGMGGWASDALVKRLGLRWGRRSIGLLGLGGGVFFVLISFVLQNPVLALISLALGFGATDFMLPNCWAVCLDIGKRYAGTVSGFMNTAAQLGGALSLTIIGYFAGRQQWNIAIATMAAMLSVSCLLYLIIDASRPLVRQEVAGEVPR